MLKSFLSAIGIALRGAFRALRRVAAFPFNLFGGGAPCMPVDDSPLAQDLNAQIANNDELMERAERIARIVSAWCMDSVIADEPAPAPGPPRVSRAVANWLPGLSRDECLAIISSDPQKVAAHIRGWQSLDRVRAVQKLSPEPWPAAQENREPESGFMFHALSAEPAM